MHNLGLRKVSPARQLLIQKVGFVNSRHFFQHRSHALVLMCVKALSKYIIFHIGIFYMIMLFLQGEGIIDKISVFKEVSDIVKQLDGWNRYEIPETTLTLNSTMALDVDSLKINVLINGPIQFDKSELKHRYTPLQNIRSGSKKFKMPNSKKQCFSK